MRGAWDQLSNQITNKTNENAQNKVANNHIDRQRIFVADGIFAFFVWSALLRDSSSDHLSLLLSLLIHSFLFLVLRLSVQ
jgi:hypothetical protein